MRTVVTILTLMLLSVPALAAETLSQAWQAALAAHQKIAAAEARTEAARFGVEGAKAERYPKLDLNGGFTQLDTAPRFEFGDSFASPKLFSNDNMAMATAQLSMPLYTGGTISNGIEAAALMETASEDQLAAVTQDIKLGVAQHYLDVLRAQSAVDVARTSVTSLKSHTADTENRYKLGAVSRNDFLAASVSLANAEQAESQARSRLELANAAYNRFVGRPLEASVALDPNPDLDALLPAGEDLNGLIELAMKNRSELGGMGSNADALRAQSEAERAKARPQLAVSGGYSYLENQVLDEDQFWWVGVNLTWSLFDSGRSRHRAAALEQQAVALDHEQADLRSMIALQVRRAWLERDEARSRGAVAEAAVVQAIENLRVVRDRYQAGSGTNTEVLDAEALRAQTLNNRDNARFDLALARVRLGRAIGDL